MSVSRKGDLVTQRKQAEIYFARRFRVSPEDISDFGAFFVEQELSGRSTTFEFHSIDYLREFCLKTSKRGSSDFMASTMRQHPDPEDGADWENHGHESMDIKRFEAFQATFDRHLEPIEHAILFLYFVMGYGLKEIGKICGFSESRACQRIVEIIGASTRGRTKQQRKQGPEAKRIHDERRALKNDKTPLDEKIERIREKYNFSKLTKAEREAKMDEWFKERDGE